MNRNVLIGIGIVLLVALSLQVYGKKDTSEPQSEQAKEPAESEAQTNAEGSVTVAVTPTIRPDVVAFEMTLDTHTGDLDYDLTKVVTLEDDNGNEYAPTGWEGDPPGGHHRKGILKFAVATSLVSGFELRMMDVGGVKERSFRW